MTITIIATVGLILSVYAYYVERKGKDKNYKALCDINNKMSCSKAFSSKYGKTFGVSNSIYGILFYLLIIILYSINQRNIIFYLAIFSVLGSVYLGYLQYFKIKNFCLVCTLIYLVNLLLLFFAWL